MSVTQIREILSLPIPPSKAWITWIESFPILIFNYGSGFSHSNCSTSNGKDPKSLIIITIRMTILLEWWCYWNGVLYIYRSVIIWRFDLRGSTALFQLLVLNEKTRAIRCISIQISLSFFLESALSWQLSLSSPL